MKIESCDLSKLAPAVGLEPQFPESPSGTKSTQNCAKSIQNKTLSTSPQTAQKQKSTVSEQNNAYSIHPKGVPGVYQNGPPIPDDLAQVVDAWDNLPKPVKAGILAMVREARK